MSEGDVAGTRQAIADKEAAHQRRIAGLMPPVQPGEVRNPKGINQYTASKRRFAAAIEHYTAEPDKDGLSLDQRLAKAILEDALSGSATDRKEVLARLWPVINKTLMGQDPDSDPVQVQQAVPKLSNLTEEDQDTLIKLAAKALQGPQEDGT